MRGMGSSWCNPNLVMKKACHLVFEFEELVLLACFQLGASSDTSPSLQLCSQPARHGVTGPLPVAGSPRYKGILGQVLAGLPWQMYAKVLWTLNCRDSPITAFGHAG